MRDECGVKRKDAEVKLKNVSEILEDLTLDIRKYGLLEDFADGEIRKRIDSIYNSIPLKQQLKYFKSFE